MIIIEGKAGKSLKLQEIINTFKTDWCNKIWMFDNVGVKHLQYEDLLLMDVRIINYDLLLSWSKNSLGKYFDNGWIVFEYNIPKELSNEFIKMAKEYEELPCINDVILTIQNNNLEEIKVYEV